jgi:hypothetical protein
MAAGIPQFGVEAQLNQLAQVGPVAGEELLEGPAITGPSLLEQRLGFGRIG